MYTYTCMLRCPRRRPIGFPLLLYLFGMRAHVRRCPEKLYPFGGSFSLPHPPGVCVCVCESRRTRTAAIVLYCEIHHRWIRLCVSSASRWENTSAKTFFYQNTTPIYAPPIRVSACAVQNIRMNICVFFYTPDSNWKRRKITTIRARYAGRRYNNR